MKSRIISATLISGLMLIGFAIGAARAQEQRATIKKVPVRSTRVMAGKDLYREYCATCHGALGKGDGPAAAALKKPPSDLTQISKTTAGKFPAIRVQRLINGEADAPLAHGSKAMPIWGPIFRHMGANPDLAAVRVYNLAKYIEAIQEK